MAGSDHVRIAHVAMPHRAVRDSDHVKIARVMAGSAHVRIAHVAMLHRAVRDSARATSSRERSDQVAMHQLAA
jgi:hypothetical protein